jgi:Fungal Zn(2)-Cys(6) binuclear cluster domain
MSFNLDSGSAQLAASDLSHEQQHQKRARQQLSCTHCRAGKLKCDRQHPCDQCLKRSRAEQCTYLPAPPKKARGSAKRNSVNGGNLSSLRNNNTRPGKNTKDRIAELEGLVRDLIRNQGTPQGRATSSEEKNELQRGSEGDFTFNSSAGTSLSPIVGSKSASSGYGDSPLTNPSSTASKSPLFENGDQVDLTEGVGGMRISNGQTSYSGSSHWETLLEGVSLIY